MSENPKNTVYCFDSSAFIDSWRRYYRPDTFKELWDRIGNRIENGSILVPDEVKKEIGSGNDTLVNWFKSYHKYVVPVSEDQIDVVRDIVNKYPAVSQYKKPRPYHADPFVVAVAKNRACTVVTYEGNNGSTHHPKIPGLCKEFGVTCCSVADFFEKEGWLFGIK